MQITRRKEGRRSSPVRSVALRWGELVQLRDRMFCRRDTLAKDRVLQRRDRGRSRLPDFRDVAERIELRTTNAMLTALMDRVMTVTAQEHDVIRVERHGRIRDVVFVYMNKMMHF